MTSLSEVYEASEREVSSPRRLYAGAGLVLFGAVLAVVAVLIGTTELFRPVVGDQFGAIKWAGILAGLAVPLVLVGVFAVLPAGRRIRAAAAISASICLLGVALFWHAYPDHWRGYGDDLTMLVSVVYLLGLFTAIWCLFVAVVNFKTRNDPGGALELNVTRKGETKVVEVEPETAGGAGAGGVGLLGTTPDGEVETQTGGPATDAAASNARTGSPAGDGGSTTADISSPLEDGDGHDAEIVDTPEPGPTEPTDRYCGNCAHFQYVRSSSGMVPYCGHHDRAMEDMDACEEWTPNHD